MRKLKTKETEGGLAKVRKELRSWIRRLHEEIHVTSVFVTHDQDEALEVADRIVILNKGKIEQSGTPDEVYHHPASEFVMHFLGDVNVVTGRVHRRTVEFGSLELPYVPDARQISGDARVFVRPFDLTIDTENKGLPALPAKVVRIHSAGPFVRVELLTQDGQRLDSEISQHRFGSMNLAEGTTVYVRARHIRVFAGGENGG